MKNLFLIFIATFIAVGCGGGGSSDQYSSNLKIDSSTRDDVLKSYTTFIKKEHWYLNNEINYIDSLDLNHGTHSCSSGNYSVDVNMIDADTTEYSISFNNCTNGANNRDGDVVYTKTSETRNIDFTNYSSEIGGVDREYKNSSAMLTKITTGSFYLSKVAIDECSAIHSFGTLQAKNYFYSANYSDHKLNRGVLYGKIYVINQDGWVNLRHKEPAVGPLDHCADSGYVKFYGSNGSRMHLTFDSSKAKIEQGSYVKNYANCSDLPTY